MMMCFCIVRWLRGSKGVSFSFKIFGGCCGTNERYIEEIAKEISLVNNN